MRTVYLIGPESEVYHATQDCPALRDHYWPVHAGLLNDSDETVVVNQRGPVQVRPGAIFLAHHRASYSGRRPCGRCAR